MAEMCSCLLSQLSPGKVQHWWNTGETLETLKHQSLLQMLQGWKSMTNGHTNRRTKWHRHFLSCSLQLKILKYFSPTKIDKLIQFKNRTTTSSWLTFFLLNFQLNCAFSSSCKFFNYNHNTWQCCTSTGNPDIEKTQPNPGADGHTTYVYSEKKEEVGSSGQNRKFRGSMLLI